MVEFFETFGVMILFFAISLFQIAAAVFAVLFMHHSARYRNHTLSVGWYICGFLFGLWTLIVFLATRKDFPGPDTKKCPYCGCIFPSTFEECQNCHMPLPVSDEEMKKKDHKLSKIFCTLAVIFYVLIIAGTVTVSVVMVNDIIGTVTGEYSGNRIAVDGVYYDKMGNSYENEADVLFYDEEGHVYTFTEKEIEDDDYVTYSEWYYVRDDGKLYAEYDCYVTEDGWFWCDKADVLEYYSPEPESMTPEELDAYYENMINDVEDEYKYYDYPLNDADGNKYYSAYEASWNANGELITAANDIY
ncbi:MAG: hypothetical protein IKV76_10680 [Clostridia bacterium]|nr:hypothetical protein [Clostridia bacterium]